MKTLIIEANAAEALRTATAVRESGHETLQVADERSAIARILNDSPAVVLCGSGVTPAFIRQLRAMGLPHYVYILLLAAQRRDDLLLAAYDAGIDYDLPWPCNTAQLKLRLRVIARMQRAMSAGDSAQALDTLANSAAWRDAGACFRASAEVFLRQGVSITTTPPAVPEVACAITLSNVEQQVELRIALGCDLKTARALIVQIFGNDDVNLANDLMCELANLFMGGMKTSLANEAMAFTGGLPAAVPVALVLRPSQAYGRQEAYVLSTGSGPITVHVAARHRRNLHVQPPELREGMVLAKDLFGATGVLLLNGGTRLSSNMIDRLNKSLPQQLTVEVMAPA